MRFLILTQYYPPEVGAAQVRLSAFAKQLVIAGHQVDVVTALPNYSEGRLSESDRRRLVRRETVDGISITRLWLVTGTGAGLRRLTSYLSFTLTGLFGAMASRKPDVVFVESPPLFLGVAGWMVAKRFGATLVLNVSDLWPDSVRDLGLMPDGRLLRAAERLEGWLYRRSDAVTAVTQGIRSTLITRKQVPEAKILFLPNGVDSQVFRPVPSRDDPRETATIVYTGNHGYAQGLDIVIDAAALAPDIEFEMFGSGSDKVRLQAAAAARGVSNVRFLAPVPASQVAHSYAGALAGLASLRGSTLMDGARPAKLLAIMACAKPVIYCGEGEGADLVRAADAGIVVQPGDSLALVKAARDLAMNRARATELGANGRRYVELNLAWPALVRDWLRQLESIGS